MTGLRRTLGFVFTWGLSTVATAEQPVIDFVHMGGNDCPPCIYWRATELPKLQGMPEFAHVRYTYVTKAIRSSVPSATWFPAEAKHLQPALAEAANGFSGSPHQAILVDGKIVDYWFGTGAGKGDATQIAAMVRAIRAGERLPRPTCKKLATQLTCAVPG
jgi:hypothetical protein